MSIARSLFKEMINKYKLYNLLNKINSNAPKFWELFHFKP